VRIVSSVLPRTQFGNPKHSDREPGPILGGWAGPTNLVDRDTVTPISWTETRNRVSVRDTAGVLNLLLGQRHGIPCLCERHGRVLNAPRDGTDYTRMMGKRGGGAGRNLGPFWGDEDFLRQVAITYFKHKLCPHP